MKNGKMPQSFWWNSDTVTFPVEKLQFYVLINIFLNFLHSVLPGTVPEPKFTVWKFCVNVYWEKYAIFFPNWKQIVFY